MTVRRRGADEVTIAIQAVARRQQELLQDIVTRVRVEEFEGIRADRFLVLLAVAVRSNWTSDNDAAIREKLQIDYELPGGWEQESLDAARQDPFYPVVCERLLAEIEKITNGAGGFRSLSDESDPTTKDAARSMRLLGLAGTGQDRLVSLKERYDRADPKQHPNLGVQFVFPVEALERLKRSEKAIEASGVQLLPEGGDAE